MPQTHCAAPELASLLDGSSAGELIPELARHGLQQLIELEVAAFLGADCPTTIWLRGRANLVDRS